jgi:hypothetical protein
MTEHPDCGMRLSLTLREMSCVLKLPKIGPLDLSLALFIPIWQVLRP